MGAPHMTHTRARLISLFLGLATCTPAPVGDCSPRTCLGCCDAERQCKGGTANDACGSGGFSCLSCGSGQRCGGSTTCEFDPNAPRGGGSAGSGGGNATIEQEYVDAHNGARRRASPTPNPALPDVSWDIATAAFAKQGADRCLFSHRQQTQYGENLYASTDVSTPTQVVDSWDSEKRFYSYETDACSNVCGHYTQVVWRTSVKIGCATARCTANSPFGTGPWFLSVCNYSPPGNFIGRKPY
jgi:pathogenesis-related protein 1